MDILLYVFNPHEWGIFFKKLFTLFGLAIVAFILWLFPISLLVAPFYGTTSSLPQIQDHKYPTTFNVVQGLENILDKGLVTNFVGVNLWIDNNYYEQIGQLEIFRLSVLSLENSLGRNRGTGGANEHLVQARSYIYSDFKTPIFTSYDTRLHQTIFQLNLYLKDLDNGDAVFIANSDNLAEALNLIKLQIQTNLADNEPVSIFNVDDKFYRIRGNLIATYIFFKGIEKDFKLKLSDKNAFNENFEPLLKDLENAINNNPLIVLETFGDLAKIQKDANVISQKIAELRDRLIKG